ncbi:uncharacterized protein FYW47_016293 [Aplochiton taeniatus]
MDEEILFLPSATEEPEEVFFKTYVPPARDAVHIPPHVLYVLIAAGIVVGVLYAIIGHLIIDLFHDLADWLFGEQPEEVKVNLLEAKDKFMVDWTPETSPELQEMARAEEIRVVQEGNKQAPAIWVIPDCLESRPARTGPRVVFGKNSSRR